MIGKKKFVKPATEAQIAALRKIAAKNNMTPEDFCWIITGGVTQIFSKLSRKQAYQIIAYENEKNISFRADYAK